MTDTRLIRAVSLLKSVVAVAVGAAIGAHVAGIGDDDAGGRGAGG